ncbi:hypothetical protein ACJ72_03907 [Emergomyces africanus]|uniref:Uncharacterized protein n=1 Tax=Emergomyces africanus TaxID=1955775 RepID=A0A1B7NYA1_9EURO|nr:hypothetical protein ACJ72_03907 [Emergomyces africanus]
MDVEIVPFHGDLSPRVKKRIIWKERIKNLVRRINIKEDRKANKWQKSMQHVSNRRPIYANNYYKARASYIKDWWMDQMDQEMEDYYILSTMSNEY